MNQSMKCLCGSLLTVMLLAQFGCFPEDSYVSDEERCKEPNAAQKYDFCTADMASKDMKDAPDEGADLAPVDMGKDLGACGGCQAGTICDTSSNQCVQCLTNNECTSGSLSTCVDNKCVQCDTNAECQDQNAPICADNKCVQCESNAQCQTPSASLCMNNTCAGCSTNADCTHLGATPVCDSNAKTCVGCTPATEAADCAGNSCDPKTNTCTTTPLKMTDTCQACVSDSECLANHRCVPLQFMGNDAGSFCLQTVASTLNSGGCPQPYRTTLERISLSGAVAEDYCGISEAFTTCQAVRARLEDKTCTTDSDCGRNDVGDGACELIAGGMRCTYRCSTNSECPNINTCLPRTNDANQRVCK